MTWKKERPPSGGRPFALQSDESVFGLVSIVVIAECVGFAKAIENSCYEIGAFFSDAAGSGPTLLEPRAQVEHVLPFGATSSLRVRRGGHSQELHHHLHWLPPSLYATHLNKFRAVHPI